MDDAVGKVFEAAQYLCHARDVFLAKEKGIDFPTLNAEKLARQVLEKNYWRDAASHVVRERDLLQKEVELLKREKKEILTREAAGSRRQKEEVEALKEACEALKEDKAEAFSEGVKQFLSSRSLAVAAKVCLTGHVRALMYKELLNLGKDFPFRPEMLGYSSVSAPEADPSVLHGYAWDASKDRLLDFSGKEVPNELRLKTCEATGVVCSWPEALWPENIDVPIELPEEVDEEDPSPEDEDQSRRSRSPPPTPGRGIGENSNEPA